MAVKKVTKIGAKDMNNGPKEINTFDPSQKVKASTMQPMQGMRYIGAASGCTVKISGDYVRLDCWEGLYVEDDEDTVEEAKRDLAARIRSELVKMHEEATEELVEKAPAPVKKGKK